MSNFQVPQFIEVEDKIFGPLTFKQFVYLAGGAGIIFLIYVALPIYLGIFLMLPVAAFSLALAFYKVNNRSFILVTEAAFKHLFKSKLYLWKHIPKTNKPGAEEDITKNMIGPGVVIPKLSQSKLKDLAWSLDVRENIK